MNLLIQNSLRLKTLVIARESCDSDGWIDRLEKSGFQVEAVRIENLEDVFGRIDPAFDLCLVEYQPETERLFEGWENTGIDVPVILFGDPENEAAVSQLALQNEFDYVLNDSLGRLGLAVSRGLKERRLNKARQSIQENERQLRTLIDSAPLGLHQFVLRSNGQLILTGANPTADRILSIEHRALIGLPIEEAFPFYRSTEIPAIYRKIARDGKPYSTEQTAYEDHRIKGVFIIHAFQTGPSAMAVFFRDITDKKKAEQALRDSEEKFRSLIEQNSEGVVLYDEQGLIIEWNTAQELCTGIPRSEALGQTAWDLQYRVLPEEIKSPGVYESIRKNILQLSQTGQSPIFYRPIEVSIQKQGGSRTTIQQISFPVKTSGGFRIGSIIRDITSQKQAELDLQRRTVELEALHAVSQAGTEAVSTADLLDRVCQIIREKLFPDHFGVALLDEERRVLTYHASLANDSSHFFQEITIDQGISGAVVRTGQSRRVDDVRLDADYLPGDLDTRSELCVPIGVSGKVIGVVNLENLIPGSFSERDERLISAVASELGTALEKIRLLEAEQNRRKELEALEQVSAVLRTVEEKDEVLYAVLERVSAVLNLQGAGFAFRDRYNGDLITDLAMGAWPLPKGMHMPQNSGICHRVSVTQHYYLANDVQADPEIRLPGIENKVKCLLCLALIVDGQTQGLLFLGRRNDFLRADVHLAIAMADTLASALHRIELHAQTQRQLERLMALRAIDQSILSRFGINETLDVLLEKITSQLQVDAANLLLYQPGANILLTASSRGLPADFIWDPGVDLNATHAGRTALSRTVELIPDMSQLDDGMTQKLQHIGVRFASYAAVPLIAQGDLKGVLQIFSREKLNLTSDWTGFLDALADQAAIAINSAQLFTEQQENHAHLTKAYEDTIDGWSRALDLRDKETEGHSQRVTDLTLMLAQRMGVAEAELVHMRRGARLHDIGKMGIPDGILGKRGPLNAEEWEIMRTHPILAADLLYPIEFLGPALDIPYSHHEKWDGSGYPQGLQGEEIPLSARIFAIVDVWDALTSDRPYRPAWSKEEAMAYISAQSGTHFDPLVVENFIALMPGKGILSHPR